MKTVILAEKPSQAKAYSEAFTIKKRDKTSIELNSCSTFPQGATITWGIGHLVSLKMPSEYKEEWKKWNLNNLPIIPDKFEFKVSPDKKGQFNVVKKLFNEADVLINGCDVDREGSNIFYSIYHMTGAKNKKIKRLWINSLEIDEVQKGFSNLRDNAKDLLMYNEAKTRQIADWLVGMNASQLFTLLLQKKGLNTTLSVGRVQSPTVYMIYQRQKEIDAFVSKPFYELVGDFKAKNGAYKGKAILKEDNKQPILELLEKNNLSSLTFDNGKITSVTKNLKRSKSPQLHSLSTLQTIVNKRWKYSPAKVLEVVQSLYEKKIVTYPRTDTNHITESEFAYLVKNLIGYKNLIGVEFEAHSLEPNKRFVDGKKVQEHYAIIPTKIVPSKENFNGLSVEERNVYDEVLRTTLAMFHKDYQYEETKIITDVNSIEFHTKGKVELDKGWKSLFTNDHEKNSDDEENTSMPKVEEDEIVDGQLIVKEGSTSPSNPYTEGGLINMMKTCGKELDEEDSVILKEVEGLGTEATRSGIIETIKKNGYVEVKKNIVFVTEKGIILCEAIEGNLLSSPIMTAKWESYLKKIGQGEGSQVAFIDNINKFLIQTIDEAPKKLQSSKIETAVKVQQDSLSLGECPICKKGQMTDMKTFVSCSNYKSGCSFSFSKTIAGKKVTDKNIKDLINKGETPLLKGFKSKQGKSFEAKLKFIDGNVKFSFK